MKLPAICLLPVEPEISGQAASEATKPLDKFLSIGFARDPELPGIANMDFDIVAFLETKGLDNNGGQADGQTISPFRNQRVRLRKR